MTHDKITELLPWYANATLSEGETAKVEAHLEDCSECRAELDTLRLVQSAVTQAHDTDPKPSSVLFQKTLERISSEPVAGDGADGWGAQPSWGERLAGFLGATWQPVPALVRAAVIVLLVLNAAMVTRMIVTPGGGETFQTATGPGVTGPAGSDGPVVKIAFEPTASMEDVQILLGEVNASIISGPSPQGFYRIVVPGPAVATMLETLRHSTDLVRFIQLEPEPGRR